MSIFFAFILGLIQGLCEFLPISSSGHLMIAEALLGITENNEFFNVLLHLATLLSVVIIFRKDLWEIIKNPRKKVFWLIVVSTMVTCAIVVILKLIISELFALTFLGFGFLFSATIIIVASRVKKPAYNFDLSNITFGQALMIGCFQGFAVLPGISRSASTVSSGEIMGINRETSLRFSFLLSVPVIIASMVYELVSCSFVAPHIDFPVALVGGLTAFISSLLSIKFMLMLARKKSWIGFAVYLTILSIAVLIFTFAF